MNTRQLTLFVVTMMVSLASAQTITGKYEIPKVPDWAKNAVFYQIYPQTFCDSDGDGIGDIQGIIYYKIAPRYGTNEDARQLFEEAHKRGMHVIFDYVISYTAIDHPWFVASQQQTPNKYSNYYIWTETNWVDPPMEFAGQFVKGYGQRNGQFMRNFYWCQPALNFGFANPDPDQKWQLPTDHPDVMAMREDLKNVLRFWMDMGADGFRADMAGALVKTRRVRGNEQFFNTNENETKLFWREIRQLLEKEYPQGFMVAEWSYPADALDNCFHVDFFHWFKGYNDLFHCLWVITIMPAWATSELTRNWRSSMPSASRCLVCRSSIMAMRSACVSYLRTGHR